MDAKIFMVMRELLNQWVNLDQPVIRLSIVGGVSLLIAALVMSLIGSLLSEHRFNFFVSLVLLVVGVFFVLLGSALTKLYIFPLVPSNYQQWVLMAAAVLVFLLVSVPLVAKANGVNYFVAIAAISVSLISMVLMLSLIGLLYDVVLGGRESFRLGRSSKRARDRALGF